MCDEMDRKENEEEGICSEGEKRRTTRDRVWT